MSLDQFLGIEQIRSTKCKNCDLRFTCKKPGCQSCEYFSTCNGKGIRRVSPECKTCEYKIACEKGFFNGCKYWIGGDTMADKGKPKRDGSGKGIQANRGRGGCNPPQDKRKSTPKKRK